MKIWTKQRKQHLVTSHSVQPADFKFQDILDKRFTILMKTCE